MKRHIFYILLLTLFCACSDYSIGEKQAEDILATLDEKDKGFQDITSDTLILKARDYYIEKNNAEKASLACFYCGRVYQEQKEFDRAMEYYAEAENFAKRNEDYDLIGTIHFFMGNMYYTQFLANEAIEKLKSSLEITPRNPNNYTREIAIYNTIGNSYLMKTQLNNSLINPERALLLKDSSLIYYDKALQLARQHKDSTNLSSIKENIYMAYMKTGDMTTARTHLKEAIELSKDKSARLYFNLARLFYEENAKDSVIYYTDLALSIADKEKNNMLKSSIYKLLSKNEGQNENYKKALEYQDQYTFYLSNMLDEKRNNDILIIENKYNYEQTQNRNNQLLIERQYILLAVLGLIILVIAVYFYSYRKINEQKTHTLKLEKASLEAEQQVQALKSMAKSFNEKEKSLRMEVLSHFDILKKVALLKEDNQLNDRTNYKRSPLERINDIVYGTQEGYNWDRFFDSISNLHREIIDKINQTFPDLDSTERKICYLSYLDFSNSEMATLLGCALNTVEQKKTLIRKKLGMQDRGGNIKSFLSDHLDQMD
ncbi:MAG: hypothetical protein LBO74_15155 [Candidatus Symbiothrix sp.]|jgi:tetratricopeptide (TPR) repeat protein|nr:hypothetical protein [Candidatus Symbiothrix sp.]